jgi:hypothetical protein
MAAGDGHAAIQPRLSAVLLQHRHIRHRHPPIDGVAHVGMLFVGGQIMLELKPWLTALVVMMSLTMFSGTSWATEQAQQRRAARDVRQETRQGSRQTKHECRAADQESNSQCRQQKRHTKHQGRETARDIKY